VALLALATVAAFWAFGLYRGTWRLAGLDDVVRCGAAVAVSTVVVWAVAPRFMHERVNTSQFVVYALVSAGLVCGSRISYRLLQDQMWKASTAGQPVLIYGAGNAGVAAMRELRRNPDLGMRPVGFIDDDRMMRGKAVSGLAVLGGFDGLEAAVERTAAQAIAISTEKIPSERVDEIRLVAQRLSIALYRFDISFREEQKGESGPVVVTPRFR
jgi:UDP-GlcNAc:undecaprenyl-phosphate GlcNAc-1-phosphate transferase